MTPSRPASGIIKNTLRHRSIETVRLCAREVHQYVVDRRPKNCPRLRRPEISGIESFPVVCPTWVQKQTYVTCISRCLRIWRADVRIVSPHGSLELRGVNLLALSQSRRFEGRYVGSARHRLNTLASNVSLILMWIPSSRISVLGRQAEPTRLARVADLGSTRRRAGE